MTGVAIFAGLGGTPAGAADIDVFACTGPAGQKLAMTAWDRASTTGLSVYDDDCSPSGGALDAKVTWHGTIADEGVDGWRFREPAGMEMQEVAWRGKVVADATTDDRISWALDTTGADTGLLVGATGSAPEDLRQYALAGGADTVTVRLHCSRLDATSCAAVDHSLHVQQLRIRLRDPAPPTASGARGTMTAPGYKDGNVGLTVDAADAGTGVATAHLEIDGVRASARTQLVDANGGACVPLAGAPTAYITAVPCKRSVSTAMTLDTSTLSDGEHAATLVLEDAAGNPAAVWSRTLRINNPGGAVPETACTDGLDNDGDGLVDHGDDPGCVSTRDGAETHPPVNTAPPIVAGGPRVGSSVGYIAGAWDDAPGAGGATALRWEACRYDGAACVEVPGVTGIAPTLPEALIGRRVRVVETRTTTEGITEQASGATDVVRADDGTLPACADGIDGDGDGLVDHDADRGCSSRLDTTEDWSGAAEDADGDGLLNRIDPDDDGDGVPDEFDAAPYDPAVTGARIASGAGTNVFGGAVASASQPPPAGEPTNGRGASNTAVFVVSKSRTRSVPFGSAVPFAGRLVNEHGKPIAGAVISIQEQPFVPKAGPLRGARFRTVVPSKPVVTDRDGRFRFVLVPKHSRTVRFGYKARTADRDFTATTQITLLVASKATFGVDRAGVRNGSSVRFAGRLLGGMVPRTGVHVVLQARTARGWVTFETARAGSRGRFAARYRFRATSGVRTYEFRARVRPDSSYPWAPSTTRTARVTVRG